MSTEELVDRAIAAFNRRDTQDYTAVFAPDALLHDPMFPEPTKGREELAALVSGIWSSFSDVRWRRAGDVVVDDGRAAFVVAIQMTHDGPMPMPDGSVIEPTGREVSFDSAVFWTLDGDLVTEETSYFDATAIALQLGAAG